MGSYPAAQKCTSALPSTDPHPLQVVDIFAGPGGWEEGARSLDLHILGIEWNEAACATRRAVGHRTLQADVAALNPKGFPCDGLIGSPPCPSFSNAGKRLGLRDLPHILCALKIQAHGIDPREDLRNVCLDERSALTIEPMRWIHELRPSWIALEQVPGVQPVWDAMKPILEELGYYVNTGVLHAERYGVPQTRKRAILVASRKPASLPTPTHQGWDARKKEPIPGPLPPPVSMASALGWGTHPRPGMTVTGGGTTTGGAEPFGNAARRGMLHEQGAGRWLKAAGVTGEGRPGHHGGGAGHPSGDESPRSMTDSIRVTPSEAALLQTFPSAYPWQGKQGKIFQQIGNAIPPLLARRILEALM